MTDPFALLGVGKDSPLHRLLPLYLEELRKGNLRMNLTGPDHGDFQERHVYDSLSALPLIRNLSPATLADVGTGAGLPGLILAMVLPEVEILLIEKSPKKCQFLKQTVTALKLPHVRVFNGRVAEVAEKVDLVVFRAVSPFKPEFLQELRVLCREDTRILAYKGRKERLDEELLSARGLIRNPEIVPVSVPGLSEERNLVLFSML